jgi:DNA-directed RNA polymerase subunit alpha
MEKIGLPKISEEKVSDLRSKFIVEPLYPGYGPTLGNALRRVLLSSIIGSAATSFKIDGVSHEFSAIPHVKEDVIQLMMNLKEIQFKSFSDEPVVVELLAKGPGEVTAGNFKPNSNIEIKNPEHHLLSLDNKANFRMEVIVEKDRGFRAANVSTEQKREIGQICIDASFSPVERVGLEISDTRVGQMTNYDKVILDIETDGTISPKNALKESGKVLVDHYNAVIADETFEMDLTESYQKPQSPEIELEELSAENESTETVENKTKVEDAGFSQRTTNALINAGIKTIAGLKRLSPLKLEEIKGLGKKGIDEINEKLGQNDEKDR